MYMGIVKKTGSKRLALDDSIAVAIFLARIVDDRVDSVIESRFGVTARDVNSVVGKLVVPNTSSPDEKTNLRSIPTTTALHVMLRSGIVTVSNDGYRVCGRSLRDVLSSLLGEDVAKSVEEYLNSVIASEPVLLSAALRNAEKTPYKFLVYVAGASPVRVLVESVILDKAVWAMLNEDVRDVIINRLNGYFALTVLRKAPWAVYSRDALLKLLSKTTGEELPVSVTQLIAEYSPELIGESNLTSVNSVKLIHKPPALVRVDKIYEVSPSGLKEFTVFDTRTRLGIVAVGRNVSEAVHNAYANLIDAYFEFKDVLDNIKQYESRYGFKLERRDEVFHGFTVPGIAIYNGYDEHIATIPLQSNYAKAFEDALEDAKASVEEDKSVNVS